MLHNTLFSFLYLFSFPLLNVGDRVEMKWNKNGNCVLLLTTTDVDSSGASYYGKQTLHFLNTKGDSLMIQLGIQILN